MRERPDIVDDRTCPRCGDRQVVIERRDDRIALMCPTCEYEVVRRPTAADDD